MEVEIPSVPVPPQYQPQVANKTDFRSFPDGPRGYKVGITKKGTLGSKRKLDEYQEQVDLEAAQLDNSEPISIGRVKKPKLNAVGIGKISGRAWKAPEPKRASAIRNPKVSSSWDTKMKVKAEKQAYLKMKREAKEARSEKLRTAREQREAAMKRKEENRSKSAVVQKLSSSTAKKMMKSKKARKHLATA